MDLTPSPPELTNNGRSLRTPAAGKVSLARQIALDLARQIEDGALAPGQKLPWREELCKHYNVSVITIRAALADLTSKGLIESRKRGGIFVSASAKMSPEFASDTFAMVAKFASSNFCAHILAGATAAAHRAGFRVTVAATIDDPELEASYIQELADRVAGVLVVPVNHSESDLSAFKRLVERKRNLVFVDHYVEGVDAPRVTSDNIRGGYLATCALLETGCGRIYALSSGKNTTSSRERMQGYNQAMQEHGRLFDPSLIRRSPLDPFEAGRQMCREILDQQREPARFGIFAITEVIAAGCYSAIKEAGLRIPEDVAVAGYDDFHGAVMDPPLTTVRQNLYRLGELGVETLLKVSRGETASSQLVPVELVVRRSTSGEESLHGGTA
ncbi:MAG: GntR family transcriptional regulator [Capsulimonadaceae bacterium]|nr:GntR family transcriptional regulator [Capsulimonadaceae bacterium]